MGNTGSLTRLAFPNQINPNNPDVTYHSQGTWDKINTFRKKRLEGLGESVRLKGRIGGAAPGGRNRSGFAKENLPPVGFGFHRFFTEPAEARFRLNDFVTRRAVPGCQSFLLFR